MRTARLIPAEQPPGAGVITGGRLPCVGAGDRAAVGFGPQGGRGLQDAAAVVLVAHGSRDPRAAASTEALARAVRRAHPEWTVHASYLDHAGPRPLAALSALSPGRRAVVVPLLLTAAYHGRVDVPAILTEAANLPIDLRLARVLGPLSAAPAEANHRGVPPLLINGLIRRLLPSGVDALRLDDGLRPDERGLDGLRVDERGLARGGLVRGGLDAVVLAAAGTRDAAARETITWAAEAVSVRLGLPCRVAYSSAAPPAAGEAVARLRAAGARRVGVAAYFLAPGRLYDLAVRSALDAGAVAVAEPLADAPEIVELIADRVESAIVPALVNAS